MFEVSSKITLYNKKLSRIYVIFIQMRCIIVILLVFIVYTTGFAQNELTKDGLKVGRWQEFSDDSLAHIYSGNYKIKHLSDYDIVGKLGDDFINVKYGKTTTIVFFKG